MLVFAAQSSSSCLQHIRGNQDDPSVRLHPVKDVKGFCFHFLKNTQISRDIFLRNQHCAKTVPLCPEY
ncbi:hypothetical protein GN956_G20593 [Arapaima gigas]